MLSGMIDATIKKKITPLGEGAIEKGVNRPTSDKMAKAYFRWHR